MTPRRALSFGLAALAFALPLSIAGVNAALAAISLAWIWLFANDRRPAAAALVAIARSPAFIALAAYAGWALVASLSSLDPAASLRLWPKDAHKLWAFLAIGVALIAADKIRVAMPLAAGLGLHAAVGVVQAGSEWIAGAARVRAHGFLHPVSYAEIMGIGLLGAAAYLARPEGSAGRRRAAGAAAALLSAALVASQTRAVLIALVAAYGAACALDARWRRHALAAIVILAGVVAFWEVMPTGGRSLRNLFAQDSASSPHRARLALWDVALRVARDRPAAGVGPGQYRQAFDRYHPENLDGEGTWGNAHNVYLHQLAERGVPGLLILLAALGTLLLGAWRAERARRDAWSLWAATATAAFLVMNLTEVAWQTEQVASFLLLVWLLGTTARPAREIL
ncbi:MAG: O-antigen ligase family protein [Elusimicrobia bacterium]|nr:O-antigen ligase family protein [Elusimicrobiota bacterium]